MRKIETDQTRFKKKTKKPKRYILTVKYNWFFGLQTSKTKHTNRESIDKALIFYKRFPTDWVYYKIEDINTNVVEEYVNENYIER